VHIRNQNILPSYSRLLTNPLRANSATHQLANSIQYQSPMVTRARVYAYCYGKISMHENSKMWHWKVRHRAVKQHCATVPFKVFPDPNSGARPWVQVLKTV